MLRYVFLSFPEKPAAPFHVPFPPSFASRSWSNRDHARFPSRIGSNQSWLGGLGVKKPVDRGLSYIFKMIFRCFGLWIFRRLEINWIAFAYLATYPSGSVLKVLAHPNPDGPHWQELHIRTFQWDLTNEDKWCHRSCFEQFFSIVSTGLVYHCLYILIP